VSGSLVGIPFQVNRSVKHNSCSIAPLRSLKHEEKHLKKFLALAAELRAGSFFLKENGGALKEKTYSLLVPIRLGHTLSFF
jgi:hypothetical protein